MRFYTKQHQFYCGIDLHARLLAICLVDQAGGSGGSTQRGRRQSAPRVGTALNYPIRPGADRFNPGLEAGACGGLLSMLRIESSNGTPYHQPGPCSTASGRTWSGYHPFPSTAPT